jgi:O-acetyl-ADP-ribose deacetylase (regulator of RNase III)
MTGTTSSNLVHKVGDIFTTDKPAIGHGVNLWGVMGSGIAVLVRRNFPEIFAPYKKACNTKELAPGGMLPIFTKDTWIFNLASQVKPGANASLDLLEKSVEESFRFAEETNVSGFALPRIGAGVGGLKWFDALEVLEFVTAKHPNVELEVWSLPDAD